MSPAEATATVAYLRRSVSQPNSWEMLRGSKGKAQAPRTAAPAPAPADAESGQAG